MRVATYVRVSSDEQVKGHSPESQAADLLAWAEREGWDVVSRYADLGISGWKSAAARDGFQAMVSDAALGRFDAVLVKNRSRYARNVGEADRYGKLLTRYGVSILSLDEPFTNGDSPAAFMTRGMFDVFAEYYSVELSHKTKRGWRARAEKGLTLGDVPFGYRSEGADRPIVPEPREAEAVRDVFATYATGTVSMAQIADRLNARGFAPRSKRGKRRFSKASVERMLANPVYQGDVTHRGAVLGLGKHAAIVERDLFARVEAVRAERAGRPKAYKAGRARTYLLSAVGRCARCGGPLWANSARRWHYYRCSARYRGEACADAPRGQRAEPIEAEIDLSLAEVAS